jgi:putative addiction module killer protein
MIILKTDEFIDWVNSQEDKIRDIITERVEKVERGSFGDYKPLKGVKNLFELRIHFGSGFRIYFTRKGNVTILILCGSIKRDQDKAIKRAKEILKEIGKW